MKVKELLRQLQTFPQDALVVTEGYEEGFDAVKKVSMIRVEENTTKEWYIGKYIDSEKADAVQAVFLNAETKADNK